MQYLTAIVTILSIVQELLPIVAFVRSRTSQGVTNAGLINTAKAIQYLIPIVDRVDTISASGPTPMGGAEKLELVKDIVADSHAAVQAAGGTTETFDRFWGPINDAITMICAAKKEGAVIPVPVGTVVPSAVAQPAIPVADRIGG